MHTLCLLRHAKSSWNDPSLSDFDRPLNDRGKDARKLIKRWFKDNKVSPDLVICSPSKRTRETLEPLLDLWKTKPEIVYAEETYEARASDLHEVLRKRAKDARNVLLVGHNPGIQNLALDLIQDGYDKHVKRLRSKFPTGGIARLTAKPDDWRRMSSGSFRLKDFAVPRDIADS